MFVIAFFELTSMLSFRPHPNECSGSDLDGDIYFVSWDPALIPPREVPPMEYTPAPTEILDHDVTIEVIPQHSNLTLQEILAYFLLFLFIFALTCWEWGKKTAMLWRLL